MLVVVGYTINFVFIKIQVSLLDLHHKQNMKKLLIATSKGLAVYKKTTQGKWVFDQMYFVGMSVSVARQDPQNGWWWVCLAHKHWGTKLHYSTDEGATWAEVPAPKYPTTAEVKPDKPATLKYVWHLEMGQQTGVIWAGTEPGGLFKSTDNGQSFALNEALWNEPSRPDHWFGGGRNYPGIHSIVVDPRNPDRVWVGISCAGVFETADGGKSWQVRNDGLKADFLPNPHAAIGHDPHLMLQCAEHPEVFWQQNHCGIFRSTNAAQSWQEVTDPSGVTKYGFTLAIDDTNPDKAWVIPATSDDKRVAVNGALVVYYTEDAGKTWVDFRAGLPQAHCFDIVLRHSLAREANTMVFGTTTGNLFLSEDAGQSWQTLNHYLPKICSVRFAF